MEITQEDAKKDLEKILGSMRTMGEGTEIGRSAQMILQILDIAKNGLDDPEFVKMMYVDNEDAKKMLPDRVLDVMGNYVNGKINETEAKNTLSQFETEYKQVFNEMGYKPSKSFVLGMH